MHIKLKLANMNKPADFIVYPIKPDDEYVRIQSDHRFARINLTTGEGLVSRNVANHPNSIHLHPSWGPWEIKVDQTTLAELKKISPKKGDAIGPGCFIA